MDFRAKADLSSAIQRTKRGENESKHASRKAAGRPSLRLGEAEQKGDSCHQGVKRSEHGVGGTRGICSRPGPPALGSLGCTF